MANNGDIFGMPISHVRAILGYVCRDVARTGRPLGIRRYRAMDVVIVPLAEWQRLKRLEAELAATEETPQPQGQGACETEEC
jgi:hypothetical protein